MIGVNLIPSSVLVARQRSQRIRWWLVMLAITAGISTIPIIVYVGHCSQKSALSKHRADSQVEITSVRDQLIVLSSAAQELEDRYDRARALSTKRPWPSLLALIVQSMPPEIWLTSLVTNNPGTAKPRIRTGKKNPADNQVVVMEGARRINLEGFALEHSQLYDFMARLKGSGAFAKVQLIKAGKEPVFRSRAVRFELTCHW